MNYRPPLGFSVQTMLCGSSHLHVYMNILGKYSTLKCLSIGTPKNNEISICSKSKIDYFWVSQNLGPLQPNYNVLKYWNI